MNTLKNLFRFSLLSLVFLSACDSDPGNDHQTTVQAQSTGANVSTFAIEIPDRIRTSQAVNLDATRASISTSAGDINLTRNGNAFEGSIFVEPGSNFSFILSISEAVDGQNVIYATSTGGVEEQINQDLTITINTGNFVYPDDDGDGASNLAEIEAGSDHENSLSTPANPDGTPPTGTTPGVLQFAANTYSVAEADGEITISVARTNGSDGRVSVRYTVNGETAIRGQDFDAASGELIWLDGDSAPKEFTVVVRTDTENDGEQTFNASLFGPTGGAAIGSGFTRITLIDSTPAAQRGTIQLTANQITIDEDAGSVLIDVERTGGTDGLVAVDYTTVTGTATEDDFTSITGLNRFAWADGEEGTRTIRIPITNDSEVEAAESFTVTLSNNIGGASLGLAQATITITDTTPVPVAGQLSLAQGSYTVAEGSSVQVVVERLEGSDGTAAIEYSGTAGTADADDFVATSGILNWSDGDSTPKTITISTLTDDILESEETVLITLENASGASLGLSTATITINDATVPVPGELTFASTSAAVDEGDSVEITVSRTGGSNGAVSADVTAPASTEYTISPAELVWADGDSEDKTISLTAIEDDTPEDTQTIDVSLSNVTGDATIGNGTIAVTITDTTEPAVFLATATDGEWEVCVAPYNTSGPSAFATQLSANEGRVVSCIKTCDIGGMILDENFPGWGWNPIDQHSCMIASEVEGTYKKVPIYTPDREVINLNLSTQTFTRGNSIWACVNETRRNAEFDYVSDQTLTVWYQFLDDGTYFYNTTLDGSQPVELIGPETWSVDGRVLEIGHLNRGYRNTLFLPGSQTLHIHPTTDNRISCTRETRPASVSAVQ